MWESHHNTESTMKKLMNVSLSLLCATVCEGSEVTTKRAQEGENFTIECPYGNGWETYIKYFYKRNWPNWVVVIQSQQQQHPAWIYNGRYSLYDDRERRVFTVIITNTTLEDTDTYSCFIDGWTTNYQSKVHLIVDRAPSPTEHDPVSTSPLVLTNITMETDTTPGGLVYSGVGLVLVLLILGLLIFIFFKQKRDRTKRSTVLKPSTRTFVPDSTTTNQDPHTGTIPNPIYSAETNQNSDVAHDITTGFCTSSNQHPDELYCNVGSSIEDQVCVISAAVYINFIK
ncbi:hypothetical protein UPYG_G00059030 [Umbra pygmaea]|uniref:Ig-like domain-containing protein n=1 Tax=Umbra pygmaea TaxID=75934 RepID=A0ABD0X8W3_UMBPY